MRHLIQAVTKAMGVVLFAWSLYIGLQQPAEWPLNKTLVVAFGILFSVALYRREIVAWMLETLAPYVPFLHHHEEDG